MLNVLNIMSDSDSNVSDGSGAASDAESVNSGSRFEIKL